MNINLHIGQIGNISLPDTIDDILKSCSEVFLQSSNASEDPSKHLNLIIQPPEKWFKDPSGANIVTTSTLHRHAAKTTKNPPFPGVVTKIGLLFAGSFTRNGTNPDNGILGIMFDTGFAPEDNEDDPTSKVPREACAVFLNTIRANRSYPEDYLEEVRYTIIHELGHIFNLGHLESTANFMASSPPDRPHVATGGKETNYHQFTNEQKALLAQADQPYIQPGGSNYGSLGGLAIPPGSTYYEKGNEITPKSKLKLTINSSQREFYTNEPLELEIKVSLPKGKKTAFADIIDTGYEECVIWIETPLGEKHRYRPTKHICSLPRFRDIYTREPFERDISIFGQSGGYTFTQAGTHHVSMEVHLPDNTVLKSNRLELHVLPLIRATAKEKERLEHLQAVGKQLFYRNVSKRDKSQQRLEHLAETYKKHWTGGASAYTLGRSFYRSAQLTKSSADKKAKVKEAIRYFKLALKHKDLSGHRTAIAEKLLAEAANLKL